MCVRLLCVGVLYCFRRIPPAVVILHSSTHKERKNLIGTNFPDPDFSTRFSHFVFRTYFFVDRLLERANHVQREVGGRGKLRCETSSHKTLDVRVWVLDASTNPQPTTRQVLYSFFDTQFFIRTSVPPPPTRTYYMLHTRRLGANSPLANVLPSLRVSRAPFHVIRWMIQINSSAGILTTHASHALSLCCVVCKQHSIFTHKQYMFLWNKHTNPIPPPTPPALAPNAIMRSKCMYGLLHYNPYTRGLFQHQADCIPCGAFLFVEQYIHSRNINRTTMLMTASNRLRETKTFYIYISYVCYVELCRYYRMCVITRPQAIYIYRDECDYCLILVLSKMNTFLCAREVGAKLCVVTRLVQRNATVLCR